MNAYVEGLNMLLEANHQDHEYSKIESLLMEVVEECAKDTDDKSISEAMGTASNKFETAINHAWKLMYLIPMFAIEDKPEKWVIVEESPLLGKDFRVCNTRKVHVDMIERHIDTVDGTPGCVYRINANSKLAFMLYGNSVVEYETKDGENMDLKNNYSCACFINQFPFVIPYPTVTTIIHVKTDGEEEVEDYGFISDIRNISREEVSAEDLHGHFFSPTGTALYPTLTEEELEQFPLVDGQPAEVAPVEEAAEETKDGVEETEIPLATCREEIPRQGYFRYGKDLEHSKLWYRIHGLDDLEYAEFHPEDPKSMELNGFMDIDFEKKVSIDEVVKEAEVSEETTSTGAHNEGGPVCD